MESMRSFLPKQTERTRLYQVLNQLEALEIPRAEGFLNAEKSLVDCETLKQKFIHFVKQKIERASE